MTELFLALAILIVPLAVAFAVLWVSVAWLVIGGLALVAAGLLVGVPAGILYHRRLYGLIERRGALSRLWWMFPLRYNHELTADEISSFQTCFRIGASGFAVVLAGYAISFLGCLQMLTR